jgi:hypothetical protein
VRQRRRPPAPRVLASRRTRFRRSHLASAVRDCVEPSIKRFVFRHTFSTSRVTVVVAHVRPRHRDGVLILTNSRSDSIGHRYMRVENSVSGIDYVFKRTWRSRLHHSTWTNPANRAQVCLRSRNRLVIPITHHQINIPLLPVCRHSQSRVVRESGPARTCALSHHRAILRRKVKT